MSAPHRLLALAAISAACATEPTQGLRWQESWELLGVSADGHVVDLVVSRGHTGVMRGQGHVELSWLSPREGTLSFARDYLPDRVSVSEDSGLVLLGGDRVGRGSSESVLSAQLGGPDLALTLQLEDEGAPIPQAWEAGGPDDTPRWTVEAPLPGGRLKGWLESGRRGGYIDGHGVVIHRGGTALPPSPRRSVYILGRDLRVGVDIQGDAHLVWADVDGELLQPDGVKLTMVPRKPVVVDFRPALDLVARIRRRKPVHQRELRAELTALERGLLSGLGWPTTRRVQGGVAEVIHDGERLLGRAVLVEVGAPHEEEGKASLEAAPEGAAENNE